MRLRPHQIDPLDAAAATVADGTYVLDVEGGLVAGLITTGVAATHLIPLTTSINGVPELVWDADNQLVMTEVSS